MSLDNLAKQFCSDFSLISIKGADAQDYLQRQVTSDVLRLPAGGFHYSALLDRSGKITSFFILGKENKSSFYLLCQKSLIVPTLARLDEFLFAEDCVFRSLDHKVYILLGPVLRNEDGLKGTLYNEYATIRFDQGFEGYTTLSEEELIALRLSSGTPVWGQEVNHEIINNTFLNQLAVSYQKGCFLGQETIAKIESRRGAAFYPVAIKVKELNSFQENKILQDQKKIGELRSQFVYKQEKYFYVILNRQNRVHHRKITFEIDGVSLEGIVYNFPLSDSYEKRSEHFYDLALASFHTGKAQEAIDLLEKSLLYNSRNEDAIEILGVILAREGRQTEAINFMQQLLKLNPKSVMAHTNLSLFYMQLGDKETAEEHKSLATVKTFEAFGDEAAQKRQSEAEMEEILRREKMFKQVLEIDEDDTIANFGLGDIFLSRKDFKQASTYLNKVIDIDENYSLAYLKLAKVYVSTQKSDLAAQILRKGINIASKQGNMMPANEMQAMLNKLTSL